MSLIRRLLLSLTAAIVCVTAASVLAPSEAHAQAVIVGGGAKFAGSSISITDGDAPANAANGEDPAWGWGGGAQVYALYKIASTFALGLNADFMYFVHDNESLQVTGDNGVRSAPQVPAETSLFVPSIGIVARARFTNEWAAHIYANYAFASGSHEPTPVATSVNPEGDYELSGFQLGGHVFYQFRMEPYKTWIEAGPFLTYTFSEYETDLAVASGDVNSGSAQLTVRRADANHFTAGLALQVSFEIGL